MKNYPKDLSQLSFSKKNKKEQAQAAWQKLEKWISIKGLKIVLILEGDENKTAKRLVKNLKKWSSQKKTVRCVRMKNVLAHKTEDYFEPLLSHLPKEGQMTIYKNCWYGKSIEATQIGKWETTLWNKFAQQEKDLLANDFIVVKVALKNNHSTTDTLHPIFEILKKTEFEKNPFTYFNCYEKKSEVFALVQHVVKKVPHRDLTFPHSDINFKVLKKRAYNLRWATVNKKVIPLTAADPDFPVAPEIQEAINDYTKAGIFSYGPPTGLPELKNAASKVLKNRKGIDCPAECILPTDGAASAMYTIAKFAMQPGDEAIIFDPVDFLFQKSVEAAGGKVIRIPIDSQTGTFNPQEFIEAISEKTKLIGLCNPHNPTGRVLNRQELLFIGSMAVRHQLWIMNDEIWSDIIFPEQQHINIASLHPEIAQRTISVYGFSKTFGLAGLRVGFIAAPDTKVFNKILNSSLATTTAGGVSTLSQIAAAAAYENCWYWADAFLEHLTKVRDYAVERLNKMMGVTCRKPEGTYLLFPDVKSFGMPSEEIALYLLKHAKVAVVPGAAKWFGPGAEGHIRICFATSMEIMKEALDRIEVALEKLYVENQMKLEAAYFQDVDLEKVSFQ